MKVLVIGSTGFIGGQIARAAVARGWQVRAMRRDDRRVGAIGDLAAQGAIEWVQADLLDPDSVAEAMRGCDVVFHAAGYYPTSSRNRAAQLRHAQAQMERVLLAFRQPALARAGLSWPTGRGGPGAKPDRLIYTSSLSTIGPPSEPGRMANETDVYQLGSAPALYFDLKIVMEQTALDSGLPVVALCPTSVFGPGDVKPTTGALLIHVARGRMPFYPDGQTNVVDVRDVAAAHVAAVEQGRPGERYILGGENMNFRQMLTVAAEQAGRRPPWLRLPPGLVEAAGVLGGRLGILGSDMLQAIRYWQPLDMSKARTELGLTTRPFAETVRDTLAWFREHGYL